jgi:Tfp pilus assembly pilus retraction ATPase PilT
MNDLLQLVGRRGRLRPAPDRGLPPVLRITASLQPLDSEPLKPEDTERLMKSITRRGAPAEGARRSAARTSASVSATWRVSASASSGRRAMYGIVLRQIPSNLMTAGGDRPAPQVKELLFRRAG